MFSFVGLTLSVLRIASNASLFLEAQRLLLRILRPTRQDIIKRLETHLIQTIKSSTITHLWIKDNNQNSIHVIQATPITTTSILGFPVIVLLHGHSMCAAFWYRNIDHLTKLGYRVLAIDLLGWGRSSRPKFSGSTIEQSTNWYIQSLYSTICELNLIKPFILMGHSLGGYIAIEYTRKYPLQVEKLVMISPAASTRKIPFKKAVYFKLPPQSIVRNGGLLGWLLFTMNYPKGYSFDRLKQFTYELAVQHPPSGELAVRPIIKFKSWNEAECTRPIIELIKSEKDVFTNNKILMVCGKEDSSIRVDDVVELYQFMKLCHYTVDLKILNDCDHCPQLEQPDVFFNAIASFVVQ